MCIQSFNNAMSHDMNETKYDKNNYFTKYTQNYLHVCAVQISS